jgi:hypothetical protein
MWQQTKSGRRVRVAPLTRRAMRGHEPELHGLRRILGAAAPRVGLSLTGLVSRAEWLKEPEYPSNHVSRDLGGQLKLRRVADGL